MSAYIYLKDHPNTYFYGWVGWGIFGGRLQVNCMCRTEVMYII